MTQLQKAMENTKEYWEQVYNQNKHEENRTEFGYSEKSERVFGSVEEISPKYIAIAEYCILSLLEKGYTYATYSKAKSGTIYIKKYGTGSGETIRISDHRGRGGVFSVVFDISTLDEAKIALSKILTMEEVEKLNAQEKAAGIERDKYKSIVQNEINQAGLGLKINYRTYQTPNDFLQKHPSIKKLKVTELGISNGQMAYRYDYLEPKDSYSVFIDYDFAVWYKQQMDTP